MRLGGDRTTNVRFLIAFYRTRACDKLGAICMKHPFAKLSLPTLTILILAIGAGAQNASNVLPPTCYLFSSFRGNGDGLHLAWSSDGLRWTAFRVGREVLTTLINAPSGQDTAPLNHDERAGKVAGVGERPGEGPKVFRWNNHYWMIVDVWKGLGVYRSDDALTWTAQPGNLVEVPGKGEDDQVKGGHADVVESGGRAFLFYFTHPGRRGGNEKRDGYDQRRSSIQVVELEYRDGWLTCDRDQPAHILLRPPEDPK
jgi:hypothetical protein